MANSVLTYKGYVAKVEFDRKRGLLYGTVQGIRDAVNFESADPKRRSTILWIVICAFVTRWGGESVSLTAGSSACALGTSCTRAWRNGRSIMI